MPDPRDLPDPLRRDRAAARLSLVPSKASGSRIFAATRTPWTMSAIASWWSWRSSGSSVRWPISMRRGSRNWHGRSEPKGVAFFGIDANQQDGPAAMGRFANANDLPFPFLKDVGNELADRLKVERTPEVLVLDAKRAIRYRGRIDDQFALGVHRPSPTRRDLAVALEELARRAGRSPSRRRSRSAAGSAGCGGRARAR